MPVTLVKSRWSSGNLLFEDASGNGIISFGNGPKLSFFGATLASRPSAYTQTYATADKTHAARTAAAIGDLVATSGGWGASTEANFDKISDAIDKLVADQQDTAKLVNAILDDLQTLGLLQ